LLLGVAASRETEQAGGAEDGAERQAEGAQDHDRIIRQLVWALIARSGRCRRLAQSELSCPSLTRCRNTRILGRKRNPHVQRSSKARFAGASCRRRDSNPRHADYDRLDAGVRGIRQALSDRPR
jgi:hypothetical protein